MKLIGFNLTKIFAEKPSLFKGSFNINTDIQFKDITSENIAMLKEEEILRISFNFVIDYHKKDAKAEPAAKIELSGIMLISTDKQQAASILKNYKKKDFDTQLRASLMNTILKKCTPRAIQLQDELNLPSPFIKIPQVRFESNQSDK